MTEEMLEKQRKSQNLWNAVFTLLFLLFFLAFFGQIEIRDKALESIKLFDFLLMALATFRLVRLFAYDTITEEIREFFKKHELGPLRTVFRLMACPWCVGIWSALAVLTLFFLPPLGYLLVVLLALAGTGSSIQLAINRFSYWKR